MQTLNFKTHSRKTLSLYRTPPHPITDLHLGPYTPPLTGATVCVPVRDHLLPTLPPPQGPSFCSRSHCLWHTEGRHHRSPHTHTRLCISWPDHDCAEFTFTLKKKIKTKHLSWPHFLSKYHSSLGSFYPLENCLYLLPAIPSSALALSRTQPYHAFLQHSRMLLSRSPADLLCCSTLNRS